MFRPHAVRPAKEDVLTGGAPEADRTCVDSTATADLCRPRVPPVRLGSQTISTEQPEPADPDTSRELRGRQVVLRPLGFDDVERLTRIQAEPGVARWWGRPDDADLRRLAEGGGDVKGFAIEADGELVGLVQYEEENEPDFRSAGIDVFLTERAQGRGLGSDAVRTLAGYLIHERGHHRLTIDPAAANTAAIRAYEKVGFRRVGVMREYWRSPDGSWRDGLLMDLLADELTPG
jgi:aminoglycoside 6'-N-acetyltransferase